MFPGDVEKLGLAGGMVELGQLLDGLLAEPPAAQDHVVHQEASAGGSSAGPLPVASPPVPTETSEGLITRPWRV